ncbi:MAG: glutaminyl-peptide cyclotransferase, partial [Candidatus Poseidoniales archaeon]|nr:glutaminyl-peptide cyclotransferase [Candidatus Poseidoniales archaeon]
FDIETYEVVCNHTYSGEGWGLCNDGTSLVMSNGTSELAFRDPEDFTVQSTLLVTLDGQQTHLLNELECVGGMIYANVWRSDLILAINSTSGAVEFTVDASQLAASESGPSKGVLNGIAYFAEHDAFLVTGKNWTSMHLVSFESGQEPVEDDDTDPESVTSAPSSPPRAEVLSLSVCLGIPLTLLILFLWTSGTPGSPSRRRIHNPPATRASTEGDR